MNCVWDAYSCITVGLTDCSFVLWSRYIGGHSDVVMGVVCTNSFSIYEKLRFVQNGMGAVPSPFDCFLAHRGLKTLHLRMEASARNAYAIALFLESHPAVRQVAYPGLPSHPQHELAKRQQHGFGSMITFYAKGGRTESATILQKVREFAYFVSYNDFTF